MSQQHDVYCWLSNVEASHGRDSFAPSPPVTQQQHGEVLGLEMDRHPKVHKHKGGKPEELRLVEGRTSKSHVGDIGTPGHPNSFHADRHHHRPGAPVSVRETSGSGQNAAGLAIGKTYERKPRRKTRQDRYEPKDAAARVQQTNRDDKDGREPSSRKRKRKGGKTRPEDAFQAPNVSQGRLTLKPCLDKALFRRGRASVSMKRSDLPDLTFSEMGFLSKTSDQQCGSTTVKYAPTDKRNSHDATSIEAISRYFSKPHERRSEEELLAKTDQADALHPKETCQASPPTAQFTSLFNQQPQRQLADHSGRSTKGHTSTASSKDCAEATSLSTSYYTWSSSRSDGKKLSLAEPHRIQNASLDSSSNRHNPTSGTRQPTVNVSASNHFQCDPLAGANVRDMTVKNTNITDVATGKSIRGTGILGEVNKQLGDAPEGTNFHYQKHASDVENEEASMVAGTDTMRQMRRKSHGIRAHDPAKNTVGTQTSESMFQPREVISCNGTQLPKEIDTQIRSKVQERTQDDDSGHPAERFSANWRDTQSPSQGIVQTSPYVQPNHDLTGFDMGQQLDITHASTPACRSTYVPRFSTPNTLPRDLPDGAMHPIIGDPCTPREITSWLPFDSCPKNKDLESGWPSTHSIVHLGDQPAKELPARPQSRPVIPDSGRKDLSAPQWRFSSMDPYTRKPPPTGYGPHYQGCGQYLTAGVTNFVERPSSQPARHFRAGQTPSQEVDSLAEGQGDSVVPSHTTFWRPNKLY